MGDLGVWMIALVLCLIDFSLIMISNRLGRIGKALEEKLVIAPQEATDGDAG